MAAAKKAKAKELDPAELAVHESLKSAQRVWDSGLGSTLVVLKEADARLAKQLEGIVAKNGGPTGKFTEASATVYRKQIGLSVEYLEKRLAGHTHAAAMKAVASSVKSTVAVAKSFEAKFTGITRPLALEAQHMQDAIVRGAGASLLQQHKSSFNRYGKAMVSDFERVLRGAKLEGLTHEQTVSRLVESGKMGGHSAASLHGKEPAHFPEPTSYVKRRYWAERIVRTETAYALGAGALQAMNVTRQTEFPDLQKKILATFDARTAPDSVAVHGQIRKLEEYFQDGRGRQYLHPPGRPNDREVIIPWRPHWEPTPSTAAPLPEVVAKAEVEAAPPAVGAEPGGKRKSELKAALQQAKAKVLAQKQQATQAKEQAQQYVLAQAKAKAAQLEGEAALGAVKLVDDAALKAAVEKIPHVAVPGAKFSAAKAKAQEYLHQKAEIAKARAVQQAAERQARLELAAQSRKELLSKEGAFTTHTEVMQALKELGKGQPKVFAELYHQVTGKSAQGVLGKLSKPLTLGQVSKELGKKLQPGIEWPKPKPKAPKFTPEQILGQKKAALLAMNQTPAQMKAAAAAFTPAELATLLKENPLVLAEELEDAAESAGITGWLHQVTGDWEHLKAEAVKAELKVVPSGAKTYVDVYQGGKKVAYYFQEGTEVAPVWAVKPPLEMQGQYQPKDFASQTDATAYSIEVGKAYGKLQEAKQAEAAGIKAASAKAQSDYKKLAVEQQQQITHRPWSEEWTGYERPATDVKTKPAQQLQSLPKNRSGQAVAMDEDYIENFDVSWTREIVAGEEQVVARFKVTEHRQKEVLARFTDAGAKVIKSTEMGYRGLKDWASEALEFKAEIEQQAVAVKGLRLKKGGVEVTLQQAESRRGGKLASGHNVVEIRFPGGPDDAMAKGQKAFDLLGIGTAPPSAATRQAYSRAKVMAYMDPDSARELKELQERTPAAVQRVWEKSVLRNPKLKQIEEEAELREVAPGHHALYSPKVAEQIEASGVQWLSHRASKGPEVIEQVLARAEDGLLSSRERYQRGLFIDGMSTGDDWHTGGADSAFLRLQTSDPANLAAPSMHGRWVFQIDTSELGRLDSYWFNYDNFGEAVSTGRETVAEMVNTVRKGLSSTNELMMQRQVSRGSIRRVVAGSAVDRNDLLARLTARGVTEINGVPLEDFVVLRPQ